MPGADFIYSKGSSAWRKRIQLEGMIKPSYPPKRTMPAFLKLWGIESLRSTGEHTRGELALFLPCPIPDCHAFNKKTDPINLANKFNVLATNSNEILTPDGQKTPVTAAKIPPVMLKFKENFNSLILEITKRYPESTFKLAREYLKVYTPNADDHRAITDNLTEIGEQYYVIPPLASRSRKVVIKVDISRLPISTDIDIERDLTEQGF
ncbi:hypothetical protein TNCT_118171 [Trichonephila clavata]|uniref:Uncharacterized protein n=1 Tax=Trichonephila clavata TaxID=2740835 RepID=A0A8X6LZY6_TRICU|nr:hypothetical protein TNCT_118171 [Trichonephila clavata]